MLEGEKETTNAYKTFFERFHNNFIIVHNSLKASDISHWGVTEYFLEALHIEKQLPVC